MSDTIAVQIAQRGAVTLPKSIRDAYGLQPGDTLTLLDLGGVLLLSPRRSEVDALADRITQALTERGETLEALRLAVEQCDPSLLRR